MSVMQPIGLAKPAPSVAALLSLAHQYGSAARTLRPHGKAAGWGPYRFCVLHAVELCLSALLLHQGHEWRTILKLHHDLMRRAELCAAHGLVLRKKSQALLARLTEIGAYRGVRYDIGVDTLHPEQLLALFDEIADKTAKLIARAPAGEDLKPPPASA